MTGRHYTISLFGYAYTCVEAEEVVVGLLCANPGEEGVRNAVSLSLSRRAFCFCCHCHFFHLFYRATSLKLGPRARFKLSWTVFDIIAHCLYTVHRNPTD